MKKQLFYQARVQELFGHSIEDYSETKESNTTICISFKTYKTITFDLLRKLSQLLNTSCINLEPQSEETGYCESCAGDIGVHYIECREVLAEKS